MQRIRNALLISAAAVIVGLGSVSATQMNGPVGATPQEGSGCLLADRCPACCTKNCTDCSKCKPSNQLDDLSVKDLPA